MRVDIIHCDCCKNPIKEDNDNELLGQLARPGVKELQMPSEDVSIDLDDLCNGCAEELSEIIENFILRRSA